MRPAPALPSVSISAPASHKMLSHSCSTVLSAPSDHVFGFLVHIASLPQWNSAMTRVVESPTRLGAGSQWVVEFRVFGRKWRSRSTVQVLDESAGRFAYRSATDDGNPSYSEWLWQVTAHPDGCTVDVKLALFPKTFWRRVLLARIRLHQLRAEVASSMDALASSVAACPGPEAVESGA